MTNDALSEAEEEVYDLARAVFMAGAAPDLTAGGGLDPAPPGGYSLLRGLPAGSPIP